MDVYHYILLIVSVIQCSILLFRYLKRKFNVIQRVKEFDAMCETVIKSINDSFDIWNETVELFSKLEYNGYKNHQTRLRLNTDFE